MRPTALAALALICSATVHASKPTEAEAAGLIVKFKTGARSALAAEAAMQGFRASAEARGLAVEFEREGVLQTRVLRLKKRQPAAVLERLARELQASDASIEYVEPDYIARPALVPNDEFWSQQWTMKDSAGIRAVQAWDLAQGFGVRVAVIDSGVRPHADLSPNLLPGYDFITNATAARDGDGRDADANDAGDWTTADQCNDDKPGRNSVWHGLHVAGIVAAAGNNGNSVSGVAPKAKVLPLRVLGPCGGTTSDIAAAITWAVGGSVSNVPSNPTPARVLNLSLGGYHACGSTYQAAIDAARAAGAVVVTAAGNENTDAATFAPANCKGVLAVAATNRNGSRSSYSNTGSNVSLTAPGGDADEVVWVEDIAYTRPGGVLSLSNTGTMGPVSDDARFLRGTSMAAPHVAGTVALMMSSNSLLPANVLESLLKATVGPAVAGCSGCGAGPLDAEAAVKAARGWRPEREPNEALTQAQYLNVFPARVWGTLDTRFGEEFDTYSVYLPANTTLRVRLSLLDGGLGLSAALDLHDVNGARLRSDAVVSGKIDYSHRNSTAQGQTLYLRARGKQFFGTAPAAGHRYELRLDR